MQAIIMVEFVPKAIIPPVLVLFDFNMNKEKFMYLCGKTTVIKATTIVKMPGNCGKTCKHQFTKYMPAKTVKIVHPKCCKATL